MCNLYYINITLLIILVAILIYTLFQSNIKFNEQFDANMTEFIPLGEQRYDLRGFPLYNRPIYDCWYDNYKNCYNSHR